MDCVKCTLYRRSDTGKGGFCFKIFTGGNIAAGINKTATFDYKITMIALFNYFLYYIMITGIKSYLK